MKIPVEKIRLREFQKLNWHEPRQILINLRALEQNLPNDIDEKVRRLRTNMLKDWREARDAAIFSYGISSQVLSLPVFVSKSEKSDHDFVMKWIKDEAEYYCPVQLKELPPDDLNPKITLDDVFNKLEKYSGSSDLAVAIILPIIGDSIMKKNMKKNTLSTFRRIECHAKIKLAMAMENDPELVQELLQERKNCVNAGEQLSELAYGEQ